MGTVYTQFLIDTNGKVSNIVIMKGATLAMDKEAVRVIGLMNGKWKPGENRGIKVPVLLNLPIRFALSGGRIKKVSVTPYNAGVKLLQDNQLDDAIIYFGYAISLHASDKDAFYNRGVAHVKSGNKEKACEDWKKACELGDAEAKKMVETKCK